MYRFIAALAAAAWCVVGAHAQEAAAPLTLARALDLAGASSPAIEVGAAQVRAATAARTAAGLRPNPSVTLQTENIFGSGPYRGVDSAETTGQLTMPLELGEKRSARIAIGDARRERALVEQALIAADLRLSVTRAYVEAIAATHRVQIAARQVEIAEDALRTARARVQAGRASPLEEQRGQLMLTNATSLHEQALRLESVARANLGRLIGAPVEGALDKAWFDRPGTIGPIERVDVERTLAARAAALDVATADAQVRLAAAKRTPDLELFAGPRRLEATRDTALIFGVTIPLQVFDRGSAALDEARAQRDKSEAERRMAQMVLAQAVASADAEVANAETAARVAAGPIDLIDAERMLAQTRLAAVDALAASHDAAARRDRLTAPAPLPIKE
jgi:cobalt-zinc-cadmium efflux system outer membrane protein